jgi:hypothetical protein
MIKKITIAVASAFALSGAQAAVVFNNGILSANLLSPLTGFVLGGGAVPQGGGVYALELERTLPITTTTTTAVGTFGSFNTTLTRNAWGVASTTTGSGGVNVSSTFLANLGLSTSTYYRITGLKFEAGGNYAALNGSVRHTTSFTSSAGNGTSGTTIYTNRIGDWSGTTGLVSFAPVASTNVNLSVALQAQRNAIASSSIFGLDNSGTLGAGPETFRAPTLYVSISPVPEPGEWAMMIAGLGVVGLIARRRRSV